jgi:transcriptional regulator with XRE-family HTH domain
MTMISYAPVETTTMADDPDLELARRVRAARAYAELTQEDMAERLGVSVVTYKRVEAGKRALGMREVRRVSEITRMPLDFFTEDIGSLSASGDKQQLQEVRDELGDLVQRLADIEVLLRRERRQRGNGEGSP